MSDLPIKVLGRNEVQVGERVVDRRYVEDGRDGIKVQGGLCGTVERFGWQEILRRMDEREEPKPAEKPTWEPGTVVICHQEIRWLERFLNRSEGHFETWLYLNLGGERHTGTLDVSQWKVHSLPHEFKVGDWFEWHSDGEPVEWNGPFQVKKLIHAKNLLWLRFDQPGYKDNEVCAMRCRHVPAPKEAKPAPFQGSHWEAQGFGRDADSLFLAVDKLYLRVNDLRDEVRRLREAGK